MHKHNIKLLVQNKHNGTKKLQNMLPVGMCGMDFSSSVRFRFGFDKNRGFGSVSVSVLKKTAGSVRFFFVDHS